MSQNLSIVFPGQGSQSVGMLADLAAAFPIVKETFEEASATLGLDLWKMSQEGPDTDLNRTENTQPAMLAAGIAVYRAWQAQGGPAATVMAGHSLGEYSALVAAGALEFSDAISLVAARGRFMQAAVPEGTGAMAAILGLDDEQVVDICIRAAQDEVAEAVNFNSPGQVVVAGNASAIGRAVELAKEAGAKRALLLPVSVPSHCSLMQPAAEELAKLLAVTSIQVPATQVLHNVDVAVSGTADEIRERLALQLHKPVRWVQTVQAMGQQGVSTIVEAGPGKVLAGLIKRIDKTLNAVAVTDPSGLEKALEAANA